jgi:50S ribosomal subunit-associated GTPase HflX
VKGSTPDTLAAAEAVVTYDLPASDGAALAWLYDVTDVREATGGEDGTLSVTVSITEIDAQRFAKRFGYTPSGAV